MDIEQKQIVLQQYLAGERNHATLASAIGVPENEILNLLRSRDFMAQVVRARKDMAATVVDMVKERLVQYANEMEKLALEATDPRVRFQALKDLLDRGGTGATNKVSLTSPAAYKRIIEEFTEDGKEVDLGGSDDSGTDGSQAR